MKWEEFKKDRVEKMSKGLLNAVETDIECPICGKCIYKDMSLVLTSYPPQHRYFCAECGWSGTSC